MAEQIAPTRSNLLQRRDQLRLASRGADLLKRKRDALIAEFFDLVKSSLDARKALSGTSQEAYFSLFLAKAWDGPEAVESLSLAEQSGLDLEIKVENLFGVKVPQVQPPSFSGDLPFSPIGAGARTLDAVSQFRLLTEALIKVAATETRLRRIGEEIKKTNRRVNALEQLVIPGINQQIKDIRSVLDQRALEEVTVLKRIKAKLEARQDEEKEDAPYPGNETGMADTVEDSEKVGTAPASEQSGESVSGQDVEPNAAKGAANGTPQSGANAADAPMKAESQTDSGEGDSQASAGDPQNYLEDIKQYTPNVKADVVSSILAYFGDAVNSRDAMTVACGQPKELAYIRDTFLKGKLALEASDQDLDTSLKDVCRTMGRSNRNKSSVTFYYLLLEKFGKLTDWQ